MGSVPVVGGVCITIHNEHAPYFALDIEGGTVIQMAGSGSSTDAGVVWVRLSGDKATVIKQQGISTTSDGVTHAISIYTIKGVTFKVYVDATTFVDADANAQVARGYRALESQISIEHRVSDVLLAFTYVEGGTGSTATARMNLDAIPALEATNGTHQDPTDAIPVYAGAWDITHT